MADYRRNEIVSGVFVVAAVGVFALFAFRVGNVDVIAKVFRDDRVSCEAYFSEIRTLEVGAQVAVAGERVGSVTAIEIHEEPVTPDEIRRLRDTFGDEAYVGLEPEMLQAKVRVEFELTDDRVRFDDKTARVALVQDGFLGRHFLSFYPGHWNKDQEPPLVRDLPADELVKIRVVELSDLNRLISSTAPVVRKVDDLLGALRKRVFDDEALDSLHTTLLQLSTSLTELSELLDPEQSESLHALVLRPLRAFLANTDRSLNDPAEGLLVRASDMLEQGPRLVSEAQRVATAAADMIVANDDNLQRMLAGLANATENLEQKLARIEEQTVGMLSSARGILDDNRAELAETARRLRRAMWEAEMAARKIRSNPAYLLFGDEEVMLDEEARDLSRTWRSGRAAPYRQRDEGDGK